MQRRHLAHGQRSLKKRLFAISNSTHTHFRLLLKVLMIKLFQQLFQIRKSEMAECAAWNGKTWLRGQVNWKNKATTITTRMRRMKDPGETRLMDGCLEVDKGTEHQVGHSRLWFPRLPLKGPYIRCSPGVQRLHPPIPLSNFLSSLRSKRANSGFHAALSAPSSLPRTPRGHGSNI